MKKRTVRILSSALIAVFLLSFALYGCGNKAGEAQPGSDTASPPAGGLLGSAPADGGIEVVEDLEEPQAEVVPDDEIGEAEVVAEPDGEPFDEQGEPEAEEMPDASESSLGYSLDSVKVTFLGETMEVTSQIMEIPGGMGEPVVVDAAFSFGPENAVYKLRQLNGSEINELASSSSPQLVFTADKLKPGWPVYLTLVNGDGNRVMSTYELAIRVNKGLMADKVPDTLGSEFGSGFQVDMSGFLPGMSLNVLPFLIPITYKTYADGAVRVGIGANSSDVDFWARAANGEMPEKQLASDMKELFYGDPKNLNDLKGTGKGMGLIVVFTGWAEGNVNTNDPIKGFMQLYVGTGFDITGQYLIFTWEVTLTGGADGQFDFSYVFDEADSEYHFQADTVKLGVKGGLELYGGVGCKLASVGAYGAGSVTYQQEMYPDPEVEHIIVAGELGLKAKLFGKVICSFTIISGSHDFVFDKVYSGLGGAMTAAQLRDALYAGQYGSTVGVLAESGGSFRWFGTGVNEPDVSNGWEDVRDFTHLLASDFYPDNHVQIVSNNASAFPRMDVIYLGNSPSRDSGNRSTLMSSYYDYEIGFISDPAPVADDGTADYDPYLYADNRGTTYVVWQNALEPVGADMTFSRIAENTEIFYTECIASGVWHPAEQITDLAGSGVCAAGARVTLTANDEPAVAYYTNDTSDPLGLGGTHGIWLSRREGGQWVSEKVAEVTGMISSMDVGEFGGTAVAVCCETDAGPVCTMWKNGKQIWTKEQASTVKFVGSGYNNSTHLTWYQNGRIYTMPPTGGESPLTPESIRIPAGTYELSGRLSGGPLLVIGTCLKDTCENAFAYYRGSSGGSWSSADLTHVDRYASVNHISAAFTADNEPVLLYSVQNYRVNTDLDGLLADPVAACEAGLSGASVSGLQLGDDGVFTDTETDLYIKARKLNRHAILDDGKAEDIPYARLGLELPFLLTVRNSGLYPIDHAYILYQDQVVGDLDQTLQPGESAQVRVEVQLPDHAGTDLQMPFELTTRDDLQPESRISVPVEPGSLEVTMKHVFRYRQEGIEYNIRNQGYSEKSYRIVAVDEARGVVLFEKQNTLFGGWGDHNTYSPQAAVFSQEGCENVTLYVLLDGEEPGDPGISPNRVFSIVPLEEIYAQSAEILER